MNKLQAINTILDEIGTGHVNTPDSRHPDARSASLQLELQKQTLLTRGWWFNTLSSVIVPLQANGSLLLGTNVLVSTPVDSTLSETVVKQGNYMWNNETGTGKFEEPLECVQYINLEWDALPHNAQMTVLSAAAGVVVRQKLSDTVKANGLNKDSGAFYTLLEQDELRTTRANVNQNSQVAYVRAKLRRRH